MSQADAVRWIMNYAETEARLVDNLCAVARIEEANVTPKKVRSGLGQVLRDCLNRFRFPASQEDIHLRTEIPDTDSLSVDMDSDQIILVLTNLIDNALKFTPRGGTVTVGARRQADQIRIWVEDTGTGIRATEASKIFERFFQTGDFPVHGGKGMGLGLNISREYVEMHGGRIWCERPPGGGCRISFTLPA